MSLVCLTQKVGTAHARHPHGQQGTHEQITQHVRMTCADRTFDVTPSPMNSARANHQPFISRTNVQRMHNADTSFL